MDTAKLSDGDVRSGDESPEVFRSCETRSFLVPDVLLAEPSQG